MLFWTLCILCHVSYALNSIWTRGQRMNVSSTYLNHRDGFSDIDPNAISSKYSMYKLANNGDNGEPIASPSSFTWRNGYRRWFLK